MNIKKIVSILLAVLMVSALAACGAPAEETEAPLTAYKSAVKEAAVKTCGEEVINITYVYDADGNCIKEICTDASGNTVNNFYTFNDEGVCTNEIHNNADGSKDKYRHTYVDGLLTKTVHTGATGTKLTYLYTHNEDGTIAGYTVTFPSKDVQDGTYAYNELGAVASITRTGAEASVTAYEYDEYGNVIKETVTVDGAETVTTYEYTYQG